MTKQERINSMYRQRRKWMFLRSMITVGSLLLLNFYIVTKSYTTIITFGIGLIALTYAFSCYQESHFVQQLTTQLKTKKLIRLQYIWDASFLVGTYMFLPLIMYFEIKLWLIPLIALPAITLYCSIQAKLDRKIPETDPEQPKRSEVTLDYVKD